MGHSAHLNLLSVQWAPLGLYGLRRYFDTGRRLPLAGAVTALVLQNLSSLYYLVYFIPFVGLYALWEIATRRAWSGTSFRRRSGFIPPTTGRLSEAIQIKAGRHNFSYAIAFSRSYDRTFN